jgi:peroxiredoxin
VQLRKWADPAIVPAGDRAVDLAGRDRAGRQTSLSAFKGKVVLLFFMDVRNPESKRDDDMAKSLVSKFKDEPFVCVYLSHAQGDPDLDRLVQTRGITWPVLKTQMNINEWYQMKNKSWSSKAAVPTVFLIDQQGDVRLRGYELPDHVERAIQTLLKEKD